MSKKLLDIEISLRSPKWKDVESLVEEFSKAGKIKNGIEARSILNYDVTYELADDNAVTDQDIEKLNQLGATAAIRAIP